MDYMMLGMISNKNDVWNAYSECRASAVFMKFIANLAIYKSFMHPVTFSSLQIMM